MIDLHRRMGHEWAKEGKGRRKAGLASNHRRKLFIVTRQIPEQIYSSFRYAHRPGSTRSRLFVSSERTSRDSSPRLIVRARSNKGTGYEIKERKKKPKQTKLSLLAAEGSSSRPLPSALLLIEATRWRGAKILEMEGKGNGEEEKKSAAFPCPGRSNTNRKEQKNSKQAEAKLWRWMRHEILRGQRNSIRCRGITCPPCAAAIFNSVREKLPFDRGETLCSYNKTTKPGLRRDSIWTFVFHCVLLVDWNINCILRK